MAQPLLSIVIPTRHEAATISQFLERLLHAIRNIQSEIVVVDDSDDDNTLDVLERLQVELGSDMIRVLHRARGSVPERTLGTAVVTGIRAARGAYVAVMDADGQHPPDVIPTMLDVARQTNADYVGGSRYMPGGSADGLAGARRKLISRGLALTTRLAFCLTPIRGVTDPLSGFFLFRRSLVNVALRPLGWKISLEILARSGARHIVEVPFAFAQRMDGDSKATLQQGLLVLRHILVLMLSLDSTGSPARQTTWLSAGNSAQVPHDGGMRAR